MRIGSGQRTYLANRTLEAQVYIGADSYEEATALAKSLDEGDWVWCSDEIDLRDTTGSGPGSTKKDRCAYESSRVRRP